MPTLEVIVAKAPGLAGGLASMAFIKGTFKERLSMALCGAALSVYATDYIAQTLTIPPGLAGFLVGLFGMAICSKAWEAIQSAPIHEAWQSVLDFIKRKLGGS